MRNEEGLKFINKTHNTRREKKEKEFRRKESMEMGAEIMEI